MNDAEFVKSVRKAYDMSQSQFADMIHVTKTTVYNWERGLTLPPIVKMAIKLRAEKDVVEWGSDETD